MPKVTGSPLRRYGVAVVASAVALGLNLLLAPLIQSNTFPPFFAAVMVSTWYGGLGPGLLATLVSALSNRYFFMLPPASFAITNVSLGVRLGLFVLTALLLIALVEALRRARKRAEAMREAEAQLHREQAEKAITRERDYSRLLIEGANAIVVGLDTAGQITVFNRAAEEITGYRREDLAGKNWFEVLVPRDRYPEVWTEFLRLTHGGPPVHFENPILTAAGEERFIVWRNSILRDGETLLGTISFGIDVTEQRRAEAQLRQSEKLAALGTVVAGLVHEINSPLGIILSRLEIMLLETEASPALRKDLQTLQRHANRVVRIAKGLLSFARQSPQERAPVDLNGIVEETLLLVSKQIIRDGIQLRTKLDPLPLLWGDGPALQQVVLNLLTNARDAVERTGEISIETSYLPGPSEAVQLTITDTGRGIPPGELSRIFDPFYTTKRHGTGLGLSIIYGIVRDHEGTITVASTPGEGTRFVLTFPGRFPLPIAIPG